MNDINHGTISAKIYEIINNCKQLVTYYKQSGYQNKLKITLKQAIETRWDSLLINPNLFSKTDSHPTLIPNSGESSVTVQSLRIDI